MKSWKVENEVWFYKNIYSRKNFVVKFISLSNKFLLKHLATKTSDKNIWTTFRPLHGHFQVRVHE